MQRNFLLTNNWPNVTKVHVVILNPDYSPSRLLAAALEKWSVTMARSQRGAPAIRVHQMGKCEGAHDGGFYQLFLLHVCSVRLFCAAAVSPSTAGRRSGPPRSAPLPSPRLSGREVLMAVATPDSLSICCGWHSSFTVTSPRLTGTSALLFWFLPPNLHLTNAIFSRHELINDLCCRAAAFGAGSTKIWQLDYFNYVLRSRQGYLWKTKLL